MPSTWPETGADGLPPVFRQRPVATLIHPPLELGPTAEGAESQSSENTDSAEEPAPSVLFDQVPLFSLAWPAFGGGAKLAAVSDARKWAGWTKLALCSLHPANSFFFIQSCRPLCFLLSSSVAERCPKAFFVKCAFAGRVLIWDLTQAPAQPGPSAAAPHLKDVELVYSAQHSIAEVDWESPPGSLAWPREDEGEWRLESLHPALQWSWPSGTGPSWSTSCPATRCCSRSPRRAPWATWWRPPRPA